MKFRVKVGYSSLCQIFSPKATEPGQELGNRKDGDTLIASRTLSEFSVPLLPECLSLQEAHMLEFFGNGFDMLDYVL